MAIDRRTLIAALGAAVVGRLTGSARAATGPALYAAARSDAAGATSLALFTADGTEVFSTELPTRGHDIAIAPDRRTLVVFGRRPGNWALAIDAVNRTVIKAILPPPDRRFFGHGLFSPDGRWLLATEAVAGRPEGVLGRYDVRDGFKRVGEAESGGIGPHDLSLLPDGASFVVANGGIGMPVETGDATLDKDRFQSSLSIRRLDGGEIERHELDPTLRLSSIRHLAVAPDGTVAFACQYQGDRDDAPPLVGLLSRDRGLRLLPMPDDELVLLNNYVGSIAFDASGEVLAATSPKGGRLAVWNRRSETYLGGRSIRDVCGLAAAEGSAAFLVTSGTEGVRLCPLDAAAGITSPGALAAFAWDNHARRI